jgi:hypothetical protein
MSGVMGRFESARREKGGESYRMDMVGMCEKDKENREIMWFQNVRKVWNRHG